MRLTVEEYAERFSMSIKMVEAKIRAGRLKHTIENETIYILSNTPEDSYKTDMVLEFYKNENLELKKRILHLEQKLDSTIDDKEKILKDERDRIERVYLKKDEQLKSFLELINLKLAHDSQNRSIVHTKEMPRVSLKRYLKQQNYTPDQQKKVISRFANRYGSDERVQQDSGEFVLDLSSFDYSDLLGREF